jgi:hypothetical protein
MKKAVSILFLQICLFCMGTTADAASLYMDPNLTELKRGDTVVVSVRLDTDEGECVNVVDGVITYSENIVPVDTSRGNSIFSLWVEEPVINKENRTITFAGGIPNGYCGRIPGDPRLTNNVVDLLFQSPGLQIGATESGNQASINFAPETHVLLNDGFGTVVQPQFFGSQILLSKEAGSQVINPWQDAVVNDQIPPEKFSITLERTTNAFSNKYFITFNTTDKQSGIDHYEVIEEALDSKNLFGWGAETAPWVTAKSPYVLDDQSLNSTIRVRALDKAGNEYIATFIPEENKRTFSYENTLIIGIGVAVALFVLLGAVLAVFLVRKRRNKKTEGGEGEIEIE